MNRVASLTLILITACSSALVSSSETSQPAGQSTTSSGDTVAEPTTTSVPPGQQSIPPAPTVKTGPLDQTTEEGLTSLLENIYTQDLDPNHLDTVIEGADARAAWVLADLLRFYQAGESRDSLVDAFSQLTGASRGASDEVDFVWAFNHLIAWDTPAWDGYAEFKAQIYGPVDSRWLRFFDGSPQVDWRTYTWGGVLADARELGDNGPCNCIPALDYPETTTAAEGDWYSDDRIVFGVVVGNEALALPIHQMEVHEMVNLTLGDRELGIPYCTLCGSAQAYYVDNVPGLDRVVLRTSGLLTRSNKVMYDLTTGSMFDTFTGQALTGPLAEQLITLEQVTVVASTWGDWKEAHPETRIVAIDGGIGAFYRDNPLGDRDAYGPIFPIGQADPRLPVQEQVVGVVSPDGVPVAFPVASTREALTGGIIEFQGMTIRLTDGIRVFAPDGSELPTHQSFWFAWSQFHPDTIVWTGVVP